MANNPAPVLLVDDDAAVREALKFALEVEGLPVRTYDSGAALLASELPNRGCLVIDYAMPRMDGIQLMGALRDRNVDLPAILITGTASRELRERAAQVGFGQLVEKPLSDAALIEGIRGALQERSVIVELGDSP
jgi:two-component system response regulator FixJ